MSNTELPPGWIAVRLEDIAEVRLGRQRSPKNHTGDQMRPYLRAANVDWNGLKLDDVKEMNFTDAEVETYRLLPGDIVLGEASGSPREVGKPALWNGQIEDCCFQNTLIRVRPAKGVDSRYLLLLLRHEALRGSFAKGARGVGIHHLGAAKLASWPILLPPMSEQRRIAEAIEGQVSRLDAAVSDLSLAHSKADRLKSLLLGKAVSGGFSDPVPEAEKFDETVIEQMSKDRASRRWKRVSPVEVQGYTPPENWTVVSLGSLSYASGYGTSTKCDYEAPGQPVLRIPNVQGGTLDLADIKCAVDSEIDLSKFFLESGDLLFVRTNGSRRLIGRVGVVDRPLPYAFASYLIRFRLTPGIVEPRWVELVTQSPLWRRAIEQYAASSAGQYNLSTETLSRLPIPLPPLAVQRRTLETVDFALAGARRLASATGTAGTHANRLRAAVLARAFAGKLVPHDPNDEPAAVLLAQIQADREALATRAKSQRTRRPRNPVVVPAEAPQSPIASISPSSNAIQQEFEL
ncbi:restriction endonuclease subunit S [Streptomyces sp. NPDC093707]|uniref:restriction endonuclease subunit S n=1 Tax=Streptomyces sp. NPDC093707 TaxID=3154984 RepID=UPI00344C00E1